MNPWAAAGLDLGGQALSGAFNAYQASKNRDFQRHMSNTAYQRAAIDLEKAGLNRVIALGSPASTPSGDSASVAPAKLGATATAASSAKQAILQSEAQTTLLNEQARLTGAEADFAVVKRSIASAIEPLIAPLIESFRTNAKNGNPLGGVIEGLGNAAKTAGDSDLPAALTKEAQQGKTPEEIRKITQEHMKDMTPMEKLKFMWNTIINQRILDQ